jgi:hypothetical protein
MAKAFFGGLVKAELMPVICDNRKPPDVQGGFFIYLEKIIYHVKVGNYF